MIKLGAKFQSPRNAVLDDYLMMGFVAKTTKANAERGPYICLHCSYFKYWTSQDADMTYGVPMRLWGREDKAVGKNTQWGITVY